MAEIKIANVNKVFCKPALVDICLEIGADSIYALIGNNGAGKTTLINCLLGLIPANSGEIRINGLTINNHKTEIRKYLGVVLNEDYLIHELTGRQYLEFMGRLYNVSLTDLKIRINDIFNFFFDDPDDLKKDVAGFSTGMKRKLALCAAVIHKPNILILDEPFSGLDPKTCQKLIRFLNFYRNKERIIFLSSHNLNYVESFATHVGILQEGRLISSGPIDELTNRRQKTLEKTF